MLGAEDPKVMRETVVRWLIDDALDRDGLSEPAYEEYGGGGVSRVAVDV